LRAGRPQLRLAFLEADSALIGERLAAREGHFFPADLLASQFRDLEPPEPDEAILSVAVDDEPSRIVETILRMLDGARCAIVVDGAAGPGSGTGAPEAAAAGA
jgi:carbohydrate kinase (thermoresistant glucokinase family)